MTRGESLALVTSTTEKTIINVGKNITLRKPLVSGHSTTGNVVIPSLVTCQPLCVQPMGNQPTWGYSYLGNQPPMYNKNYQLIPLGNIYHVIHTLEI